VRDLEREHVPLCRQRGVGILAYAPLAGGFLTGKYAPGQEPPEGARLAKWRERLASFDTPRHWRVLDAVREVARQTEAPLAAVALAWLLSRPAVTSVIFGARSVAQVEENLRGAELSLAPEQIAALDQASKLEAGYPYEFIARVSQGRW
jgi:aryl-alcohol dehydrogenase-like predicted oxidoreductase